MNIRWKIVTWLTTKATEISGTVLKERNWPYQLSAYKNMDPCSLGYKYFDCIATKQIEYKANLVKHDMKHIIFGYDMTIKNELNLVACLIGNKSANKVAVLYLIVCILIVPEYTLKLQPHYQRRKATRRIKDFELSTFVTQDLNMTRNQLNLN